MISPVHSWAGHKVEGLIASHTEYSHQTVNASCNCGRTSPLNFALLSPCAHTFHPDFSSHSPLVVGLLTCRLANYYRIEQLAVASFEDPLRFPREQRVA